MALHIPPKIPAPGFYWHYKHDLTKGVTDMAYYVFSIGLHTEDDCAPRDRANLAYRPLYDSEDYPAGPFHFSRPLEMFYEPAMKDGQTTDRFIRITDEAILDELKRVYLQRYPHPF